MTDNNDTHAPLPPGDYTIKPVATSSSRMVKCEILGGRQEGRAVFISIDNLVPRGVSVTIGEETLYDGTVRNTFNLSKPAPLMPISSYAHLDITRPVRLRNGQKARIVCHDVADLHKDCPLLVLVMGEGFADVEHPHTYHESGLHFGHMIHTEGFKYEEHPFDLVYDVG